MFFENFLQEQFLHLKHLMSRKCIVGDAFLTFPLSILAYNHVSFTYVFQFPPQSVDFCRFLDLFIVNNGEECLSNIEPKHDNDGINPRMNENERFGGHDG